MLVKNRKRLTGKLVKFSSNKTIKVLVENKLFHNKFKKIIKSSKLYLVHFTGSDNLKIGDTISIVYTRPISKLKNWKFEKKLEN